MCYASESRECGSLRVCGCVSERVVLSAHLFVDCESSVLSSRTKSFAQVNKLKQQTHLQQHSQTHRGMQFRQTQFQHIPRRKGNTPTHHHTQRTKLRRNPTPTHHCAPTRRLVGHSWNVVSKRSFVRVEEATCDSQQHGNETLDGSYALNKLQGALSALTLSHLLLCSAICAPHRRSCRLNPHRTSHSPLTHCNRRSTFFHAPPLSPLHAPHTPPTLSVCCSRRNGSFRK